MYGDAQYGQTPFGEGTGKDNENQDQYFVNLAKYAPPYMAAIQELKEIYNAQGYAVGYLERNMNNMAKQFFPVTATIGLAQWEKMYGLTTNFSLTYELRREILLARIRGQGTTTKKMIEDCAAAFSEGEVKVIEDNSNYLFVVRFIGIKGIPRNMLAFINMLEDIKPAHLACRFEYRYTIWDEIKPYIWKNLESMTWEDVRILKEA